jgi:hypothetical protein
MLLNTPFFPLPGLKKILLAGKFIHPLPSLIKPSPLGDKIGQKLVDLHKGFTKLIGSPMITITSYRCFISVTGQSMLLASMRLQLTGMELTDGLYHQFVLYQEFFDT